MKKLFALILISLPMWCMAQKMIPATALQSDASLLWQSLNELHPGMYRHVDTTDLVSGYEKLLEEFSVDRTQEEAFKNFSEFVVKIKCGHTYLNPFNQPSKLIDSIIADPVLLPFSFRIIENKIIVDSSRTEKINSSAIIKCINDIPVATIIDSLSHYVKADGNRMAKKKKNLEVSFGSKYNYFDYYFPLIYGFRDSVSVELEDGDIVSVPLFDKKLRDSKGLGTISYDDMWSYTLEENYAYLKLGTFVTWKMTFDWESYLDNFFIELDRRKIKNLIIDIRDNEGGLTELTDYLTKKLAKNKGKLVPRRKYLAYRKVSDNLRPHLSTWSKWFYNVTLWTKKYDDHYRTPRFSKVEKTIKKNSKAYEGETFLLINEANSSATFILAENCKVNNYATLVGTETGGTKMGITGGQIFFLTLPNTKIEIDIPLIGSYPTTDLPDEGILPDISIPVTLNDFRLKIDSQLEYIIENLIVEN